MQRLGERLKGEWEVLSVDQSGAKFKAGESYLFTIRPVLADNTLPQTALTVSIWTPDKEQGKGYARAALERLKELADSESVPLIAVVHPFQYVGAYHPATAWLGDVGFSYVYREPDRSERTAKMRSLLLDVGFESIHHSVLNVEDVECRKHCFATFPEGMDWRLGQALIEAKVAAMVESDPSLIKNAG